MKTVHLKNVSIITPDVEIEMDLEKYGDNLSDAQYALDNAIMASMEPFMPLDTGNFIQLTQAKSESLAGTGRVIAGTSPQGRFLYYGKVMIDPETGSPWARKDAKKVVTERPLSYSRPSAVPEWFIPAAQKDMRNWVEVVKNKLMGG